MRNLIQHSLLLQFNKVHNNTDPFMLPSQGTDQYQPLDQPLDLLHYPGGGSKCRMNFFETVLSFLVRSGPMKVHTSCHLSSLLHEAFLSAVMTE